ncbi:MAG TPA: alpha-amylase family glycosyl hydrolase [Kofleriaceae bacterium]|nr:alpha-amylase family glycosyl hydrolase [Kofleriaceae bacterium]
MAGLRSPGRTARLVLTGALVGCAHTGPIPDADRSPVAVHDPGSQLPDSWVAGPVAQIYVRGYFDSDGDGIGDLEGVTRKLDYLQALGVSAIWLMPIMASQDHDHGYAVTDFRAIESAYGSLVAFDHLIAEAHARHIAVILDYVINHSAAQNPLFQHSSASRNAPLRDWYVWSDSHPVGWSIYGKDPWHAGLTGWYFAGFWDQMPDFNLRSQAVIEYHRDNLRFWLNRGVDGFRFDATANLIENGPQAWENQPEDRALMHDIRSLLDGYARRWMVCEAPPDPFGFAQACGSAFGFGHQRDLINAARGDASAIAAVASYFTTAPPGIATLLANHDSFAGDRVWEQLGGDLARYRLAAATYLLQPGVPFIYYGEEIGMARAADASGDPGLRAPMSWSAGSFAGFSQRAPFRANATNYRTANVADEDGDPGSLLNFYRAMIALRRAHPSLAHGDYAGHARAGLLWFSRHAPGETSLVAINYGDVADQAQFSGLPVARAAVAAYPSGAAALTTDGGGALVIDVSPRSFTVFTVAD